MNERTLKLIDIMAKNNLSCRDVATILGRSEQTVIIWRCKHAGRIIPAHLLELLELKIAQAH